MLAKKIGEEQKKEVDDSTKMDENIYFECEDTIKAGYTFTCHFDEIFQAYHSKAKDEQLNEIQDCLYKLLLRIDKKQKKAVGVTLFNYSVLAQPTAIGQRSFPLTGLALLPEHVQEMVIQILRPPPVNEVLWLSTYTPSLTETVPIASLWPALKAA